MPARRTRLAVLATALVTIGAGTALGGSPTSSATPAAGSPTSEVAPARASTTARDTAPGTPREREPAGAKGSVTAPSPEAQVLPRRMRGPAAVRALGDGLPAVAARSGISADQLRRTLSTDRTAWVSEGGRLFYMEEAPAEVTGTSAATASVAPAFATGKTFTLHSRPGSKHTIFLDFDGANVSGTAWNTQKPVITAGMQAAWTSDGDPATFTSSEHGFIQEVWRQVAETYAAFDVDVTTQDTGKDAWTRTTASDTTYGTHVVVTSSATPRLQVCGGCLGVAWMGTFADSRLSSSYQPAWVFADKRYDATIIAQAAAHETGHTLGLEHDATKTKPDYYPGTSAWGPVMGSALPRAVSQFSKGEYAGANNLQDDLAVIAKNGLAARVDDHGNAPASATKLGTRTTYAASGVISTRTDKDVFALDLPCRTGLTASATGIGAQTTLDLSLEVLNASGAVVATSSPASSWSAVAGVPVSRGMDAGVTVPDAAPGTYYVRVDGVGNGSAAGTGWSDYGSLGQYQLAATGCPAVAPAAKPSSEPSAGPTDGSAPAASETSLETPASTETPTTPTPAPPTSTPPKPAPAAKKPSYPVIRTASSGAARGKATATARWVRPSSTGGAAITKYRVRALKRDSRGRVVRTYYSAYLRPTTGALVWHLPKGRYSFTVMAWNRVGASPWSRSSAIVTAR